MRVDKQPTVWVLEARNDVASRANLPVTFVVAATSIVTVLAVAMALVTVTIAVGPRASAQAGTVPQCFGRDATVQIGLGQSPTRGDDVIVGTMGDDAIAAGDGDDLVCGLGGNDSIWGQVGNDQIDSGDGDDLVRGGPGDDLLHGGPGADDLNGGVGNDHVFGQGDSDAKVRGGSGDDVVDGGLGDDLLVAGNGGADSVLGGDGNDLLVTGGPRPDTISGGPGDDILKGHKGADVLLGETGDDQLFGGPQPDQLDGGPGADLCTGGTQIDTASACEYERNLDESGAATDVRAVGSGSKHSCAAMNDGTVSCWGVGWLGSRDHSQSAQPFSQSAQPIRVQGIDGYVIALSVGHDHSCVVTFDGSASCWGWNYHGQVGNGSNDDQTTATRVMSLDDVSEISSGRWHTCAISGPSRASTVSCWGSNHDGQVGPWGPGDHTVPVAVPGLDNPVAVDAGESESCAALADGSVWCWGTALLQGESALSVVPGITDAIDVSVGGRVACAVISSGVVRCWPAGAHGDPALGEPVTVIGVTNARTVNVGATHACATLASQQLTCWRSELNSDPEPQLIDELTGVTSVANGTAHTCASTMSGDAWCWGSNLDLQLGNQLASLSTTPMQVVMPADPTSQPAPQRAVDVSAGANHSCVLDDLGSAWCWGGGSGFDGQVSTRLEYGSIGGSGVDSGFGQSCMITFDDEVRCWETIQNIYIPAQVSGNLGPVTALAVGEFSSCAVHKGGMVTCWSAESPSPANFDPDDLAVIDGITDAVDVVAGQRHFCVLRQTGTVSCWGSNTNGTLGDGTTEFSEEAVAVVGLSDVVAIDAGSVSTCAVTADGSAHCWGNNSDGQLGTGGTEDATVPVVVEGVDDAVTISTGWRHTCVLHQSGDVSCWGANDFGQLGDGTSLNSLTPQPVEIDGPVADLDLGALHSCAIDADGLPACWGDNRFEQLGVVGIASSPVPIAVQGLPFAPGSDR